MDVSIKFVFAFGCVNRMKRKNNPRLFHVVSGDLVLCGFVFSHSFLGDQNTIGF